MKVLIGLRCLIYRIAESLFVVVGDAAEVVVAVAGHLHDKNNKNSMLESKLSRITNTR